MSKPGNSSIVRFSTIDLPEKDRVAMWREHYGRELMKLDVEPLGDAKFECTVNARLLPGVQLLSATTSPLRVKRTRELATDGNDELALVLNQSGPVHASARDSDVVLRKGDALLMSSTEATTFERSSRGSSLTVLIPRSVLALMLPNVDSLLMNPLPHTGGLLDLLHSYARSLFSDNLLTDARVQRAAAHHLHDLVALALGATRDAADLARQRGLPASRFSIAKSFIIENSSRRDLSVTSVAEHAGMTPRMLQRMFERDGLTFTEFLLAQRLNHAHRILTEPRSNRKPVGNVGYEVGFNDLSYFHRAFRKRFGGTPREIKNEADFPDDV